MVDCCVIIYISMHFMEPGQVVINQRGLTHVCMCVSLCFPGSSAVVVVRGAGPSPPAASPEEPAERTAGESPHAAQHEQHEARPHTQVSHMCETCPIRWTKLTLKIWKTYICLIPSKQ